jgi:Raf kinase inhibitor-like YbhB/YbcL family protein
MKFFLLLSSLLLATAAAHSANSVFSVKSSDIKDASTITNDYVYNGFGCTGNNRSPQISWKDAPKETKSFAITVYDPDAPTGSGWWHWLVVNIPANYKQLPTDFGLTNKAKLKDGIVQIRNDFGIFKFGGPCPPIGDKPHRYIFTVFALSSEKLEIEESATPANAGFIINKYTLAKTSFEATYAR